MGTVLVYTEMCDLKKNFLLLLTIKALVCHQKVNFSQNITKLFFKNIEEKNDPQNAASGGIKLVSLTQASHSSKEDTNLFKY